MTVLRSVCLTLLSLFLHQVDSVHSSEHSSSSQPSQTENYYWPSQFKLSEHRREGIIVYHNATLKHPYAIYANPFHDNQFAILDSMNRTVLQAQDDDTAKCRYKYTYQAFPDANYTIDPRNIKTDHWHMSVPQQNGNLTDITYFRSRSAATGDFRYQSNGALVATIRYSSSMDEKVARLKIEPQVTVDPRYFIALWTLVKLRLERCGA